jgi:hypothetical protein
MKLHDFIPGLAYRTVCLYGFPPQTREEWRAAYEMLLRCFERIGVKPNMVTVDDAPGLSDATMPIDMWRTWIARHEFPIPSALSAGSGYLGRLNLRMPWLHTRAHGNIYSREAFDGGRFMFISDAGLDRWTPGVYTAIARDAWSIKPFEYGYAHTHADPISFASGSAELHDALRRNWQVFTFGTRTAGPHYSERLRDIFPLNYLVESHLSFQLGGQSLREWIIASPARGALTNLEPGLWCWSVPENIIPQVRSALEPSGLLVAPGGS